MPALQSFATACASASLPIADSDAGRRVETAGMVKESYIDRCPLLLGMPMETELLSAGVLTRSRPAAMRWASVFPGNNASLATNKCFWICDTDVARDPVPSDCLWLCPRKRYNLGRLFMLQVVVDSTHDGLVVELMIPFSRQIAHRVV